MALVSIASAGLIGLLFSGLLRPHPLNVLPIVGLPALIGVLFSRGDWRPIMGAAMAAWSPISLILAYTLVHLASRFTYD